MGIPDLNPIDRVWVLWDLDLEMPSEGGVEGKACGTEPLLWGLC